MKKKEIFAEFSKEQQAEYEKQIIECYGEQGKAYDEEILKNEFNTICQELTHLLERKYKANAKEAQSVIRKHYRWLKNFWTRTKEYYAGHGQFIADSDFRKVYEVYHPQLPEFIAEAIQVFANKEYEARSVFSVN